MSDIGTGKEINSRNFRVARSEYSDYCLNGDCINGDVLKVVSKLAKRILSDPRILGLRTAKESENGDAVTDTVDVLQGRAGGSRYYIKKRRRVSRPNIRRNNEENGDDEMKQDENKKDFDTSSEEIAAVVKVDTTVNCYHGEKNGRDSSVDHYWHDDGYNEGYVPNDDYIDTEHASSDIAEGRKLKPSVARAIEDSVFDINSFTKPEDYYVADRYTHKYDKNRLNHRYNDPSSYHALSSSDSNNNLKDQPESQVASEVNLRETDGYQDSGLYSKDDDSNYGGGGSYGGGYGGYGSYGGYSGYEDSCCKNKMLPILLVGMLGLLAFFLYIRSTTVAAGRSMDENDLSDVLLDGPTWLSMVHELWEQDAALENTACTQETLCRMNRLAMAAPGQAGWAVSLSSLPLSYLLHTRHSGGFTSYVDASLMGRSGANCTELYLSCPRLTY